MRPPLRAVPKDSPTPAPGRMLAAGGGGAPGDRTSVSPPHRPGQPGGPASLLLVSALDPRLVGGVFALDADEVIVGRAAEAGIRVDDPGVSRSHVRLTRDPDGRVVAEDLGSTNGTFVNGLAIRKAVLADGDRLQLGTTTEFLLGGHHEAAQAEVRLRQALSTAGAGTWVWLRDGGDLRLHGGVVGASIPPAETTEPRGDDWQRVHPDDRAALGAGLARAVEAGGRIDLEARLLRRGGGTVWVAISGEPFRDEAGRVVRLAGALLDVTERRRVEVELRRQSLLFESLADAVVVVGRDGTVLEWSASAARLLGWSREEALGRRPGALLSAGGSGRVDEVLAAAVREGRRHTEELTLQDKSGAAVPVEMVAVPLPLGESDQPAGVAVFRDQSERRRLMARLRAAEQLASLGTLAAGVAHEINNPLCFVVSNLDFIAKQLRETAAPAGSVYADVLAALADSQTGASRIAGIVRDLQTYGRTRREAAVGPVDANAALEFALKVTANRISQHAMLVRDLRPVPPVVGDEVRLGQIFVNLLVNAAQAIEPGRAGEKRIRVSSRHEPARQAVIVEVADDGAGIPPEVLPRIFEPFFTTKPFPGGTGLGLFVCQGIVSELGGEISVESEVGRGSTFRVLLPVEASSARPAPAPPRVLVVDDEPLVGAGLGRTLRGRCEVVAVGDPREALARIRSGERFDGAVVDLQMPVMSGREFLAALRELDPGLAGRAVAITGGSPEEAAEQFDVAHRPVILSKPIDSEKLMALIDPARARRGPDPGEA